MSLTNLAADLNLEATQEQVLEAISALVARASSSGDAILISGSKRKYRHEFTDLANLILSDPPGTGQTRVADPATGILTIATGTTANAESSITTTDTFTIPFKTAIGLRMSQKLANQEVYFEVVATGTTEDSVDESVVAAWRLAGSDSTSGTVARAEVRNGETARAQSGNLTVQNHVNADAIFEMTLESDEVWFTTKAMDSTASRLTPYLRNSIAPDPNRKYRLRLRVKNGATAPASSTTVLAYFITSQDYTEQQVEVTGGNGSIGAAQAIPTYSTGGSVNIGALPNVSVGNTPNMVPNASASGGGASIWKVLSAASTNATLVKGSAGRLYGYQLANISASWRYVRLYNKATAPTVGTDSPALVIPIPPNGMTDLALTIPTTFGTGIGFAITAAPGDLDATAVAATDVVGHLLYL